VTEIEKNSNMKVTQKELEIKNSRFFDDFSPQSPLHIGSDPKKINEQKQV